PFARRPRGLRRRVARLRHRHARGGVAEETDGRHLQGVGAFRGVDPLVRARKDVRAAEPSRRPPLGAGNNAGRGHAGSARRRRRAVSGTPRAGGVGASRARRNASGAQARRGRARGGSGDGGADREESWRFRSSRIVAPISVIGIPVFVLLIERRSARRRVVDKRNCGSRTAGGICSTRFYYFDEIARDAALISQLLHDRKLTDKADLAPAAAEIATERAQERLELRGISFRRRAAVKPELAVARYAPLPLACEIQVTAQCGETKCREIAAAGDLDAIVAQSLGSGEAPAGAAPLRFRNGHQAFATHVDARRLYFNRAGRREEGGGRIDQRRELGRERGVQVPHVDVALQSHAHGGLSSGGFALEPHREL